MTETGSMKSVMAASVESVGDSVALLGRTEQVRVLWEGFLLEALPVGAFFSLRMPDQNQYEVWQMIACRTKKKVVKFTGIKQFRIGVSVQKYEQWGHPVSLTDLSTARLTVYPVLALTCGRRRSRGLLLGSLVSK